MIEGSIKNTWDGVCVVLYRNICFVLHNVSETLLHLQSAEQDYTAKYSFCINLWFCLVSK